MVNWMGFLQQLGRALMLPTIALPLAAVLLFLGNLPWDAIQANSFGHVLTLGGQTIFKYLPFLFAIGVALGLTGSAAIAGMSALLGYFLYFELTTNYVPGAQFQLGVIGGILIGIITAMIYNRFKSVKFPEYIQFFGGPRIVPIFAGIASILFAYLTIWFGPFIYRIMEEIGRTLIDLGGFGAFLYGVMSRLLVVTGLHHILNNVFLFQVGTFEAADGTIVQGDLTRFFEGDPTAGIYMAGLYPIILFALPAIAFAIIQESREDLKNKIKLTFLSAALASFLTGVTEPIEFAFLFVAPFLFVIHAILSGISMWIAVELDIHHGYAYSAGAIDYLLNFHLSKNALWLLPIGLFYGIIYYILFRFAIRRFRIPTPGREEGSPLEDWAYDIPSHAPLIVQALGGKENILKIDACITRLRLTLMNMKLMDTSALRRLGAIGVIRLGGGNVQVVFGTYSELIREEITKVLHRDVPLITFCSPVQGRMIPLSEVPDPIFAGKMVGDGVAFIPEKGELVSPVDGKVVHVYPSHHALGLETEEGAQVLLHIGIDTSALPGDWFEAQVEAGDVVQAGQLLVKFQLDQIRKHCTSLASPMVITNSDIVKSWNFAPFKTVKKGQRGIMSIVLKNRE